MKRPTLFATAAFVGVCLISTVTFAESTGEAEAPRTVATQWGEMRLMPMALELHVAKLPSNGTIEIPRMNNRIGEVYLRDGDARRKLTLKPGVKTWSIALPKSAGEGAIVVVQTKETPHLPAAPQVIAADEKGDVTLPAHAAITHGKTLRYEPQPHKNTVGYWSSVDDWCQWKFRIEKPGRFAVHVLQGCGKGHGGSEVDVVVGEAKVSLVVEDTGHFQNFKSRRIGEIEIANAGLHALEIRPRKKAAGAVMDVRQVRLERLASDAP